MKQEIIGIGALVVFLFAQPPARSEEAVLGSKIRPVQVESNFASEGSAPSKQPDAGGSAPRSESILPLQTSSKGRTTGPERESQALKFHKNSLLDRFGGADAHGQILLSFSANRIDLMLRSITGEEAPVAGVNPSPKK